MPDGGLDFRMPDGRPLPLAPARPRFDEDVLEELYEQNAAAGVQLHKHSLTPGWTGERVSIADAISVMHPLARRPSVRAGGEM